MDDAEQAQPKQVDIKPQKANFPFFGLFVIGAFLILFTIGGCFHRTIHDGPPTIAIDVKKIKDAVPRYLPKSRFGNPHSYIINGRRYRVLKTAKDYDKRGIGSWYGTKFHGQLTSTREPYNMFAMTAASPDLPLPCFVRVTNLENGKQIIVKVNDRGPFAPNRILDLSYAAAKKLGYANKGTAMLEVTSIDMRNPLKTIPREFAQHRPHLYLQVAAFSELNNAEKLRLQLQEITHKHIQITHRAQQNHTLYRVKIGPLNNVDESDQLHERIKNAGLGNPITVIG